MHYVNNDAVCENGSMILFDLGARWEYYCADVNLVRLITIFLGLTVPQSVIIAYIVAIFLIPDENK